MIRADRLSRGGSAGVGGFFVSSEEKPGVRLEQFKPLDDVVKPDERHVLLGAVTGMQLTLEGLHGALELLKLNPGVPEEIGSQFNVTRNLALYTYFSYALAPVVQLKGYILIEHALNIRDDRRNRGFKELLKKAVNEGWISDSGFCHVPDDPDDDQKYCRSLIDILPALRNEAAHGSNSLSPHVVQNLTISKDFINQLFLPLGCGN